MSGHCNDCGNTLCICKEVEADRLRQDTRPLCAVCKELFDINDPSKYTVYSKNPFPLCKNCFIK